MTKPQGLTDERLIDIIKQKLEERYGNLDNYEEREIIELWVNKTLKQILGVQQTQICRREQAMRLRTLLGNESGIKVDTNAQEYIRELIFTYATFYVLTSMVFVFSW